MKQPRWLMVVAVGAWSGGWGCEPDAAERSVNTFIITSLQDAAVTKGVITQHALFPYHFVADTATLNELGERDVALLAEHYCEHTGTLNLPRLDTVSELYQARIAMVKGALAAAGVAADHVVFVDVLAAGDGQYSEWSRYAVGVAKAESPTTRNFITNIAVAETGSGGGGGAGAQTGGK